MRDITNREAVEMMNRCKDEIMTLRAVIDRLKPKAEAYDNLVIVLSLLPRQSQGMGEDLVWTLNKRIKELDEMLAPAPPLGASS
jgi:flagellar biosynthesis regulator FlbT